MPTTSLVATIAALVALMVGFYDVFMIADTARGPRGVVRPGLPRDRDGDGGLPDRSPSRPWTKRACDACATVDYRPPTPREGTRTSGRGQPAGPREGKQQ